jgi:hypothetical protein
MGVQSKNITQSDLLRYLKDNKIIDQKMVEGLLEGTIACNFSSRIVHKELVVDFNYWDVVTVTTD